MTELINRMENLIPVAGFILDITFLYILVHFLCFNYRMGIEYRMICLAGNIMSLLCGVLIARLIGYVLCQTNLFATIQGFLMNSFPLLAGAEASAIMTKRILYHRCRTDPDSSDGSIHFQASYRPDTPKKAPGSYPRRHIRSSSSPVFRVACIIFL